MRRLASMATWAAVTAMAAAAIGGASRWAAVPAIEHGPASASGAACRVSPPLDPLPGEVRGPSAEEAVDRLDWRFFGAAADPLPTLRPGTYLGPSPDALIEQARRNGEVMPADVIE